MPTLSREDYEMDQSLNAESDFTTVERPQLSREDFLADTVNQYEMPTDDLVALLDKKPESIGELEPGLPEWEKEFAGDHPITYAAGRALYDTAKTVIQGAKDVADVTTILPWTATPEQRAKQEAAGDTILRYTPFFKRVMSPDAVEEFMELDNGQKATALAWDSLEVAMWSTTFWKGAWTVAKATFIPVSKAVGKVLRSKRMKLVEDAVMKEYGAKPFVREQAGRKMLKQFGLTDEEEIYAILHDEISTFIPRRISVEKKAISPYLRQMVEWSERTPMLKQRIKNAIDPDMLRARHYRQTFQKKGKDIFGSSWQPKLEEQIFHGHVNRLVPGANVTLETASPELMTAVVKDMFLHPKVARKAAQNVLDTYAKIMPDVVTPTRVVYGTWEASHQAHTGVFKVVKAGKGMANKATMEWNATFAKMMEQYGLGKATVKKLGTAVHGLKFKPGFSKKQWKNTWNALMKLDDEAMKGAENALYRERIMPKKIGEIKAALDDTERRIMQAWGDFSDSLYGQMMQEKIPQIFERVGINSVGRMGVESTMAKLSPRIAEVLATNNPMNHSQKIVEVKKILKEVTDGLKHPWLKTEGRHPWFNEEGKELGKKLSTLKKELTMPTQKGKSGNFVGYLENYIARVGNTHRSMVTSWDNILVPGKKTDPVGRMKGFFTKGRSELTGFDPMSDFDSMIRGRIAAQANDLYLYPQIQKAVEHLQKVDAPAQLRSYTELWISRILGRPSNMDIKVANLFKAAGMENLPKSLGGGIWDERRVMELATTINKINMSAGLGFKPFAMIRDMFQSFLLTAADLGGLKSISHYAKGIAKQLDPSFREYCKHAGIIGEFVPEVSHATKIVPFGIGAKADKVFDASLWMFQYGDRWNRYVTAGAAWEKWAGAVDAVGGEMALSGLKGPALNRFIRKSGLSGRYPWAKNEILDMISRGDINGAKGAFIRDVVADVQYLYDVVESPVLAQTGGIVTKTAALFQSWWMNYGTLMEKWLRTGDAGMKANRMFTFMLHSAAAETMMTGMWGESTAKRTTGLGPFPSEFYDITPASWQPILKSISLIKAVSERDPDNIEKQLKALDKTKWMFIPGGLQLKQMVGAETFAEAIFRFKQSESDVNFDFLRGR